MEKTCNKCGIIKPLTEFHTKKGTKDGKHYSCATCENARKKKYEYTTDQWKEYRLKKKFGLTLDDYNSMLVSQNSCCAICQTHISEYVSQCDGSKSVFAQRKSKQNFSVDHCHNTGKIRGLLCYNCNLLLGNAKDKINLLTSAIDYLKRHQEEAGIAPASI
jgi:hypothetical protein